MSKTNRSYINNQAVQVLNKVEYDADANPIGLTEDPNYPLSANFGTDRLPRRGGCYKKSFNEYLNIPGLLFTDSATSDGSLVTISSSRIDLTSSSQVWNIKIYRSGVLWAHYKCSENSGSVCYDSSGNGNHGTIVNAITTTPEENPNSIHQYQDVYSWENEVGYSESGSVIIPRNESISIPPFKDVLGNNLQYIGKVPGRAKFVESNCFQGNSLGRVSYSSIPTLTLGDSVEVELNLKFSASGTIFGSKSLGNTGLALDIRPGYNIQFGYSGLGGYALSNVIPVAERNNLHIVCGYDYITNKVKLIVNGIDYSIISVLSKSVFYSSKPFYLLSNQPNTTESISPINTGISVWNLKMTYSGSSNLVLHWPLCEPIINPSSHIYHDVSGNGNHATLVNGSVGNEGKQNEFHYLQKGFNCGIIFNGANTVNIPQSRYSKISMKVKTTDTKFILISENTNYQYALCGDLTSSDLSNYGPFSSYIIYVDGNLIANRRDHLALAISDGNIHTVELIHPTSGVQISNSYLGRYSLGNYDFIGTLLDVKFDSTQLNTVWIPKQLNNNLDSRGNPLTYVQDGKSFLPSGCFLRQYQQPSLIQADKSSGLWFDANGEPYDVSYNTLTLQDPINDQVFIGNSEKDLKLGPIVTHTRSLGGIQRLTERVVRDVIDTDINEAFIHEIEVTSADLTYILPKHGGTTSGVISWGDGTSQVVNNATVTKVYSTPGKYLVSFTGVLNQFVCYSNSVNSAKITRVISWGDVGFTSLSLQRCINLVSIPNEPITGVSKTSLALTNLFAGCAKLDQSIPDNLLMYCSAVTNVSSIFSGCTLLNGSIPENLFRYCPNLIQVNDAFNGCTNLVGSIPRELFKYSTKITTASSLFVNCSKLSGSIPEDLFRYNPLITSFATLFYACSNLTGSIPKDLFRYNTEVTAFSNTFYGCSKLSGQLPTELFKYNTKVTTFQSTFQNCSLITGSVPNGFFDTNTKVTSLFNTFAYTGLTGQIPAGLLTNLSELEDATGLFWRCDKLVSTIPSGFFKGLSKLKYLGKGVYNSGSPFTLNKLYGTIPTDLFEGCTSLESIGGLYAGDGGEGLFSNCSGLTGSIPPDLFKDCVNLKLLHAPFEGCTGLDGVIPPTLISRNPLLHTFRYAFSRCTNVTSIPSDLFRYNTLLTEINGTFKATNISSIPVDLFRYNTGLLDVVELFQSCSQLFSLPADLFRYNTFIRNMANVFAYMVHNLDLPDDLFKYNTEVTTFSGAFNGTFIDRIPIDLFRYNTKVTNMSNIFINALRRVNSIPQDLFAYNTLVTSFNSCFRSNGIAPDLPVDLFRYNTLVSDFSYCFEFYGNSSGIPSDIFRYNTEVTNFLNVFGSSSISNNKAIPEDLFYYNTKVTVYAGAFSQCRNLILPSRLFNISNLGKVTSWVNFMYSINTSYSPTGTIQKIWDVSEGGDVTYTTQPVKTDAFNNCTALANYAEIPTAWI